MIEESNYTLLETHIEKIPGFEITPDLQEKQACTKIYTIAGLKTMNMKKEVAGVLKKLLDDRRRLLCILIELLEGYERKCRLDHNGNCQEHSFFGGEWGSCGIKDGFQILKKVTGKTIDELIENGR